MAAAGDKRKRDEEELGEPDSELVDEALSQAIDSIKVKVLAAIKIVGHSR